MRDGLGLSDAKAKYCGGEIQEQTGDSLVHADAFSVLFSMSSALDHLSRGSAMPPALCTSPFAREFTSRLMFLLLTPVTEILDSRIYSISLAAAAVVITAAPFNQVKLIAPGNLPDIDVPAAKNKLKAEYVMSLVSSEGFLDEAESGSSC